MAYSNLVLLIQNGSFEADMIPTVGFNMRKVTKGNVMIKVGVIDIKNYEWIVG